MTPVAWRVKDFADGWILCHTEAEARFNADSTGNLIEPLYSPAPVPVGERQRVEAFVTHAETKAAANGSLVFCSGKTLKASDLRALLSKVTAKEENGRLREALERIAKNETECWDNDLSCTVIVSMDMEEAEAIARAALSTDGGRE